MLPLKNAKSNIISCGNKIQEFLVPSKLMYIQYNRESEYRHCCIHTVQIILDTKETI